MRNILSFHKELPPQLLTYEEIIAMTINDAVSELNTNPEAYYNKLDNEGHLVTPKSTRPNCIGSGNQFFDWSSKTLVSGDPDDYSPVRYNNGIWVNG